MAYPGARENVEYLKYVEQWSLGEGEFATQPKMSKEEWRKRMKGEEKPDKKGDKSTERRSIILGES